MKQSRPFKDKQTLKSLKKLRKQGYTYPSLAFLFNVDMSTVYHHVKGLMPRQHVVFDIDSIFHSFEVDTGEIISLLGLHVSHPKTYNEYLMKNKYPNISKALSGIK